MAHWAELDDNNIVLRVLVGDNNDPNNDEGYQWLVDNLGGTWIKTSYNSHGGKHLSWGPYTVLDAEGNSTLYEGYIDDGQPHLRYNFAGPGDLYDPIRDAFIPPKPFESWILNEETCNWNSPVPRPTDGGRYVWNEELVNWEEVVVEE
jgi:hypothetical protein